MASALPNLFIYENYREYLKDSVRALKLTDKKFSYRYFARVAGFNSHNTLRMVMIGKVNLSPESIDKFCKAFKFNVEESVFFKNLVLFNQAKSSEEKELYAKEIYRSKTYRKIHPLKESQHLYFKHWYFAVVREMVALPSFREDPDWIAAHTVPTISPSEAKLAVEELLKLGLLKRDENHKLTQVDTFITTTDEVTSTYLKLWHKEYIKRGADTIDTIAREQRDISAVYFSFPLEKLQAVKEKIHKFREDILELSSQQSDPNAVMQINLQLFPISWSQKEKS